MALEINRDPDLEWLDHVPPVGLVVAPTLLKELGLIPTRQSPIETGEVSEIIGADLATPALSDPWAFVEKVLGWEAHNVAGAPGGPAIPNELLIALPEHGTTLAPNWAVTELGDGDRRWQLLVRIEERGVDPDARNALDGWEATPHQRFERLLRDTGVFSGLLIYSIPTSPRSKRVFRGATIAPSHNCQRIYSCQSLHPKKSAKMAKKSALNDRWSIGFVAPKSAWLLYR